MQLPTARFSRVEEKLVQPQAGLSYLFRPRIQKGRSPGPALAWSWPLIFELGHFGLEGLYHCGLGLELFDLTAQSGHIRRQSGDGAFQGGRFCRGGFEPRHFGPQRLETGFQFLQALLHLRRRLPPAGPGRQRSGTTVSSGFS